MTLRLPRIVTALTLMAAAGLALAQDRVFRRYPMP